MYEIFNFSCIFHYFMDKKLLVLDRLNFDELTTIHQILPLQYFTMYGISGATLISRATLL